MKTIGRSAGRSATAAIAYRTGARIVDERSGGQVHDYRRRSGVESSECVLPADAPAWAGNRSALWNAAEAAETRKNSTVAREIVVALPAELDAAERVQLVRDLAHELVERHGCAVDLAVHAPHSEGDERNHHAHLLLTTRRLGADGFGAKTRELDVRTSGEVDHWRLRWAQLANGALQRAGSAERVDHRSHAALGIEQEPSQHLGPAASGYERRTGQASEIRQRERDRREQAKRQADQALQQARSDAQDTARQIQVLEAQVAAEQRRQLVEQERLRVAALAKPAATLPAAAPASIFERHRRQPVPAPVAPTAAPAARPASAFDRFKRRPVLPSEPTRPAPAPAVTRWPAVEPEEPQGEDDVPDAPGPAPSG